MLLKSKDLIVSQEDKPGTRMSTRQIAQETGVSECRSVSLYVIVNKDLLLKCFKRRRVQELTAPNRLNCLVRWQQLIQESQVSARQPRVYEDLFLPSHRCLTPLAEERLAISTQSVHH